MIFYTSFFNLRNQAKVHKISHNRAELNGAEVPHTRCLPPVVAQVPHIFVRFHALSVFGGGSPSPGCLSCNACIITDRALLQKKYNLKET